MSFGLCECVCVREIENIIPSHQLFHPLPIQLMTSKKIRRRNEFTMKNLTISCNYTGSLHLLCFIIVTFFRTSWMSNEPGGIMVQANKVQGILKQLLFFLCELRKPITQSFMHNFGIVPIIHWMQVPVHKNRIKGRFQNNNVLKHLLNNVLTLTILRIT